MPYETLRELEEDDLLALWSEFVAYSEEQDRAMKARMASAKKG